MKSDVETNEKEGNTSNPPSTQSTQKIHHFFTYNNYNRDEIYLLKKVFNEICYMFCFQEEKGENATPHLQGVLSLKKKMRYTEFGLPKQIHWEKVINVHSAYKYCSDVKKRHGEIHTKNFEINIKFNIELKSWMEELINKFDETPDAREICWVFSKQGGVGKTSFCKYMLCNRDCLYLSKGNYRDLINMVYNADMTNNNIVLIDIPRNSGNRISYSAVEAIKNGLIMNSKYETGFKMFDSPHIVIFANEEPQYELLSEDRWNVVCID